VIPASSTWATWAGQLALAALASALAAAPLVALARRFGPAPASGAPDASGGGASPVPRVGGALVALVWGACALAWGGGGSELLLGLPPRAALAALAAAWLVGTWDDLVAPRPGPKLAAQLLACAPLVLGQGPGGEPGVPGAADVLPTLFLVAGALAALNVANTFDNADGALAGVGLLGLAPVAPAAAGALLGFLPWNLTRRRGAPRAWLGDAGSHLVGMALFLHPSAWPALFVPALDLARLCVVRGREGSRPWVGDRRHLAHRLERRGVGPVGVAALLAGASVPAVAGVHLGGGAGWTGLAASALAFLALVAWSRDPSS